MRSIPEKVGLVVRSLRTRAGYSQEAFANTLEVHRTTMGVLERGGLNPRLSTLMRAARGLGMTLGEFFTAVGRAG